MSSAVQGAAADGKGESRRGAKGAVAAAEALASKQKQRKGRRHPLSELRHQLSDQQQPLEPTPAPLQQRHSKRGQMRAGQQPIGAQALSLRERVQQAQQGHEPVVDAAAALQPGHVQQDQGTGIGQTQARQATLEPAAVCSAVDSDTSDAEFAELQRREAAETQRAPHSVSSFHDAPLTKARAQLEAAAHTAALAAARGSKRSRQPTWKACEASAGPSQQQQQRSRQRRRVARCPRGNGGVGGLDGLTFGTRGGATTTHQPMQLLPGEEPLGLELYMGQAGPMLGGGRASPVPQAAGEGSVLEGSERYSAAVQRARKLMGCAYLRLPALTFAGAANCLRCCRCQLCGTTAAAIDVNDLLQPKLLILCCGLLHAVVRPVPGPPPS